MQQAGAVALEHALGRGGELRQGREIAGAQARERFWPEARMGDVGGQHLQLGGKIAGLRRAAQVEGVVVERDRGAIDLAGQGPLRVV